MKMKSLTVGTVAGVLSLSAVPVLTSTSVMAAEEFHVNVTCTTSGTDWNGSSNTCKEDNCKELKKGFYYDEGTIGTSVLSKKGGGFSHAETCEWWLSDPIEVVTGVKKPSKACVRVHARSKSGMGHIGHKGYATCQLTGNYITATEWKEKLIEELKKR